jgi:hypothetical protein
MRVRHDLVHTHGDGMTRCESCPVDTATPCPAASHARYCDLVTADPAVWAPRLIAKAKRVPPPVTPPSLVEQAVAVTSSMTKWIAAGRPRVSPEVQAERLAACCSCEHRDAATDHTALRALRSFRFWRWRSRSSSSTVPPWTRRKGVPAGNSDEGTPGGTCRHHVPERTDPPSARAGQARQAPVGNRASVGVAGTQGQAPAHP